MELQIQLGRDVRIMFLFEGEGDAEADGTEFLARYPKAQVRDFDGDPKRLTELDAIIAYLQSIGTAVDFNAAAAKEQRK